MNNFPPVTKWLLISNVVIFALQELAKSNGIDLVATFGLHFFLADNFQIHQLFTYMFLHANLSHLFFNMFALWMFGRLIESTLGVKHFLIYYLICGIGAGFCQEIFQYGEYCVEGLANFERVRTPDGIYPMGEFLNYWRTVGASGAVYGILLAFGFIYPNQRIMLLIPPIPMKAKYFVIGYAALELYSSFSVNDNVAHFAHLGGMLFGFILLLRWTRLHNPNSWWERLKKHFSSPKKSPYNKNPKMTVNPGGTYEQMQQPQTPTPSADLEEKRRRIDELLDKIKKSGYESLTTEEKNFLFDASTRK
jgi:membrane associated rhomboid family serine protease